MFDDLNGGSGQGSPSMQELLDLFKQLNPENQSKLLESDLFAGFLNPNNEGSINPDQTKQQLDVGNIMQQIKQGSNGKSLFKNIGGKAKEGLSQFAGSIKSGGAGYDLLQGGMSMANAYMNKDLVNSEGFNKVNTVLDGAASIGGKINPILGLAIKGVQTGLNVYNNAAGKRTEDFSIDTATQEIMGGSYTGSYSDMASAEAKAGLKYGAFNKKAYNKAKDEIDEAQRMDQTIQNINEDNQDRMLMAQNTSMYGANYNNQINGGLDVKYLRAAKLGIKLDNINRLKKIKINQKININTKQIEEFKQGGTIEQSTAKSEFIPVIVNSVESFKDGGEIINEFVPIIIDPIEIFKDGGKSNKKPQNRTIEELIEYAKTQNPRFIQRMSEPLRYIRINTKDEDGNESWGHATHEMNYRGNEVFPMVQEINGKLFLFDSEDDAYDNAKKTNNILTFDSEDEAKLFAISGKDENGKLFGYKLGWQDFFELSPVGIKEEYSVNRFKDGGKTEETELVKLEETNQKNVIPEGALHKNKHHIENTEGLTQKGIPVIDNDGEQQAEIELDEIIFTLEVTKKLEELHKIYKEGTNKERDEAAIEAGKLLVQEILYNTDDRTGLISKCEKGGKLNGNVE